ncbi:CP2 transcription factor-domain-containing protein [Aspergillus alliaceus]|uniref:CP2 transcription factor-domain-containing protein n=1 Tax=Petromyces alliaceus TaxID=209559 RepID=A0A5N7CRT8_PETAA|nr:CP2 transcription factor-domain-containing protein [Aspergillus alliaceus]
MACTRRCPAKFILGVGPRSLGGPVRFAVVCRSRTVGANIAGVCRFRYHVTLQAPTAMFDHTREIPMTYLNKSQVYSITVTDLRPPAARSQSAQYRTSIGISFEEAAHRSHPATCWQLWHDARGGSDAQRRGGRPCAVEFVALKGHGRPTQDLAWHLESASFNRFCVAWTTGADARASECQILVRFHFLSTDFTQSKGVKGVPVRLCAKTEMVSAGESPGEVGPAEVCYCRVKVFRDHGAERKLSNDIAHIQKSIHRVEKQIARADYTGVPGKKHKRRHVLHDPTGSTSRSSSVSTPGDLYKVLFDLQQRFSSPLPMSVLSLAGNEHDDPDQFATTLTVENNSLTPPDATDTRSDDGPTDNGSRGHSPFQAWPGPPSTKVAPSDLQPGELCSLQSLVDRRADFPAVACFYIKIANDEDPNDHYRAAYLNARTVRDLSWQVCKHAKVDPSSIVRVVHLKRTGLSILVDDDVVQHIPEGQDMIANFEEIPTSSGDAPGRSRFEVQLSY